MLLYIFIRKFRENLFNQSLNLVVLVKLLFYLDVLKFAEKREINWGPKILNLRRHTTEKVE